MLVAALMGGGPSPASATSSPFVLDTPRYSVDEGPIAATDSVAGGGSVELGPVARDTTAARDTSTGSGARNGSARRARSAVAPKRESRFSKPRWVMLRSLVVPGWGQAYNRAWLKAGLIAAAEVTLVTQVVNDQKALDRLLADVSRARGGEDLQVESDAITAYNRRLDSATTRQYLLGALLVYSLVDAYVDAHFRNFKIEFETDPALPKGSSRGEVRMGWEMRF